AMTPFRTKEGSWEWKQAVASQKSVMLDGFWVMVKWVQDSEEMGNVARVTEMMTPKVKPPPCEVLLSAGLRKKVEKSESAYASESEEEVGVGTLI
ncbi:MAG: hypothetical protein Q9226_002894, partial [Calogaya cf. arnoldii]